MAKQASKKAQAVSERLLGYGGGPVAEAMRHIAVSGLEKLFHGAAPLSSSRQTHPTPQISALDQSRRRCAARA